MLSWLDSYFQLNISNSDVTSSAGKSEHLDDPLPGNDDSGISIGPSTEGRSHVSDQISGQWNWKSKN